MRVFLKNPVVPLKLWVFTHGFSWKLKCQGNGTVEFAVTQLLLGTLTPFTEKDREIMGERGWAGKAWTTQVLITELPLVWKDLHWESQNTFGHNDYHQRKGYVGFRKGTLCQQS